MSPASYICENLAGNETNHIVIFYNICGHWLKLLYVCVYVYQTNIIIFSLIIVTASTSDHHDLYNTKQEKDRYIVQLTHELQSVTREKKESQEIITTLQAKLQEYKQQVVKTKGCKCNN